MKVIDEACDKMQFESTGKVVSVNRLIIGISPKLSIHEGFDGGFGDFNYKKNRCDLTKKEASELADYMINLWSEFKNKF